MLSQHGEALRHASTGPEKQLASNGLQGCVFRSGTIEGAIMASLSSYLPGNYPLSSNFAPEKSQDERKWYAVFTIPQNERSVVRQLELREVESFLPTCETTRVWKNRQRVKIVNPLFPTYVFARIRAAERSSILRSPGVLRIVGNSQGPLPIPASEIDFLRSDFCRQRVEPFRELVVGEKVRIRSGSMQGVQGTLVRKKSSLRFVLTLELINQHAAVEVDADELEPVLD
jgi:transcription antitermination factor NusG